MTGRSETLVLQAGICRICGCTERNACIIKFLDEDGEQAAATCSWVDSWKTLCNNPACIAEVPLDVLEPMGRDESERAELRRAAGR